MKKKLKKAVKNGNKKEVIEVTKYIDNNKEALELMEASVSLCKKYEKIIKDNVKDLTDLRDEIARFKDAIVKRVKALETFKETQIITNKEVKEELKKRLNKEEIEVMIRERVKEEVEKFIKERGLDFNKKEVSKMVDEDMNKKETNGGKDTTKELKEDTVEEALKKWLENEAGEGRGKNKGGLTNKSKKSLVHIFVTHKKNSLDNIKKYANSIRISKSGKPNKNTRHKMLLKKELKTYIKNYEVNKA